MWQENKIIKYYKNQKQKIVEAGILSNQASFEPTLSKVTGRYFTMVHQMLQMLNIKYILDFISCVLGDIICLQLR